MIECRDYQVEISALLDGESDPATALDLLEHVAGCDVCGAAVKDFRVAQAQIDRAFLPAEPVGPEVGSAEPDLADVVPLRRSRHFPARHWAWGIAAMLTLAVGGYLATEGVRPDATLTSGDDTQLVVRLGEDPGSMNDDRFFQMTTELLRADRTYRDQMYSVLEAVRTGAPQETESTIESAIEPDTGRESIPEPTLPSVALD